MLTAIYICICSVARLTCPPRKDEADWLVELTGSAGEPYRADPAERMALGLAKVPVTAEEFHAKWLQSDWGKAIEKARFRCFCFGVYKGGSFEACVLINVLWCIRV